ncbi:hypothetical protein HQ520_08975 [bacterium]|nr:hypothetical protein [bacterium]
MPVHWKSVARAAIDGFTEELKSKVPGALLLLTFLERLRDEQSQRSVEQRRQVGQALLRADVRDLKAEIETRLQELEVPVDGINVSELALTLHKFYQKLADQDYRIADLESKVDGLGLRVEDLERMAEEIRKEAREMAGDQIEMTQNSPTQSPQFGQAGNVYITYPPPPPDPQ